MNLCLLVISRGYANSPPTPNSSSSCTYRMLLRSAAPCETCSVIRINLLESKFGVKAGVFGTLPAAKLLFSF